MFVGTLVPLMVVAPKLNVLLSETTTGVLPAGCAAERLDCSLLQPTIKMVADMIPMMIAFFIKRNAAERKVQPRRAKIDRKRITRPTGVG